MNTRSDKIYQILRNNGGKLKVSAIVRLLSEMEGTSQMQAKLISSTVYMDNITREMQGRRPRFNRYGDGTEDYGFVSIRNIVRLSNSLSRILDCYEQQIPAIIEKANLSVRQQLKKAIQRLSWREFESNFLLHILEAQGFQGIEITQPSHDGGKDAICSYQRGLIKSQAIVSAKHWTKNVGADEVHRLRGIKGSADTGIVVTSAYFSQKAIEEAKPSQNQRSIVLINADMIVETCINHSIGVKCLTVPKLYKLTNFS